VIDIKKTKVFADGADIETFKSLNNDNMIEGFTTNPTLMKSAGVKDYKKFALDLLEIVKVKEISFEVFADDLYEMEDQAREISSWAKNVAIKIPISNTKGESAYKVVSNLTKDKIKCNVTAVFTKDQWIKIKNNIDIDSNLIISIFAGRIADTGIDPVPIMQEAVKSFNNYKNVEILWASPREVLNYYQAQDIGCHIITMPNNLIQKLKLYNKNLSDYSLETVKMFYNDAVKSGFKI
tara:strand:+ start:72 stop:782 length:711 start_codon:yes stop_codon:yes gene_type:complete